MAGTPTGPIKVTIEELSRLEHFLCFAVDEQAFVVAIPSPAFKRNMTPAMRDKLVKSMRDLCDMFIRPQG